MYVFNKKFLSHLGTVPLKKMLKAGVVPSVFAWTTKETVKVLQRRERLENRKKSQYAEMQMEENINLYEEMVVVSVQTMIYLF